MTKYIGTKKASPPNSDALMMHEKIVPDYNRISKVKIPLDVMT
jgi:hypothetical protein